MIGFALDGERIRVAADGIEADVLRDLAAQLDSMLRSREGGPADDRRPTPPDDPALARLLPDAIRDDPDAARELRALTEPSLVSIKREQLRLLSDSIAAPGELDDAAETAWLRALTDLRVTIATRLGIERDGDLGDHETEAHHSLQAAFAWLGGLQEDLVALLDERDERRAGA